MYDVKPDIDTTDDSYHKQALEELKQRPHFIKLLQDKASPIEYIDF